MIDCRASNSYSDNGLRGGSEGDDGLEDVTIGGRVLVAERTKRSEGCERRPRDPWEEWAPRNVPSTLSELEGLSFKVRRLVVPGDSVPTGCVELLNRTAFVIRARSWSEGEVDGVWRDGLNRDGGKKASKAGKAILGKFGLEVFSPSPPRRPSLCVWIVISNEIETVETEIGSMDWVKSKIEAQPRERAWGRDLAS